MGDGTAFGSKGWTVEFSPLPSGKNTLPEFIKGIKKVYHGYLPKTKNYIVMCKLGLLRPKGQYIEKYIKLIEHCGLANISKFEYSSRAFY